MTEVVCSEDLTVLGVVFREVGIDGRIKRRTGESRITLAKEDMNGVSIREP
jgi:hypothetical protein